MPDELATQGPLHEFTSESAWRTKVPALEGGVGYTRCLRPTGTRRPNRPVSVNAARGRRRAGIMDRVYEEWGPPMKSIERKNFDTPDETRPFEGKGYAEVVIVAGKPVGRGTFEPGWRWSTNVKPIAKTDFCQVSHLGYIISGRMRIMMEDGSVEEFGPGDVFGAAPGHDAEVIGNEPCVNLDFGEIEAYAKRA